jgi:hypothetical protein
MAEGMELFITRSGLDNSIADVGRLSLKGQSQRF